jgi:site-specific DNA recombinase
VLNNECPFPPGSRVAGYFRDSGGEDQERSVDQQRRFAEGYCQQHHLVLMRVFADEARPGGTVVGREAFDEMIHYLRQLAPDVRRRSPEAPDGVLLWDLKRFARNAQDNAFFKADLRRRGYLVVFLSDNIPPGDIGHVYEAMLEWKAQQDLVDISKDAKRGLADLVSTRNEDGDYLGLCPGRPPTGFKGEPYVMGLRRDGRPRIVQRWVPDPDTWELARKAWDMRVQGASYREIHEATRLLGTIGSYATFFRNRIYTGALEYGGEEYLDFVPAMVSQEAWDQVQAMRKPRAQKSRPWANSDYVLSGLLHCSLCTRAIVGDAIPARADAGDGYSRRRYRRYVCLGWKQKRECSFHYVGAEIIEEAVFKVLLEQVLQPEHLLQILEDARPDELTSQALELEAQRVEAELADVQRAIERLVDAVEKSGYSASLQARLDQREGERATLAVELANARRRLEQTDVRVPFEVVADFCYNAGEVLKTGTVEDIRALLRTLVVRIELEPERGRVIYTFPPLAGI